ncbi:MAG: aldo/keto reductase [Myxococcota bacterium]
MHRGYASPDGTTRFRERLQGTIPAAHFRACGDLWLSSIGLGTYLGADDDADDQKYFDAARHAGTLGVNVFDTAINYRSQRSERTLGRALAALIAEGKGAREEFVVCSKGGYLPFDGARPADPAAYFEETYVSTGIIGEGELAAACHCIAPRFLESQLAESRRNLGLETLDVYYVHNPEHQLEAFGPATFRERLRDAFGALEGAAARGEIRQYGIATWQGFREAPGAEGHLELGDIVGIAREAGGGGHHFGFVQLPMNFAMPEAITLRNQSLEGKMLTMVEAADRLGITLVASASLLQARLVAGLSPAIGKILTGLESDAQRSIQFVRSTPGISVALVGMKNLSHVEENLSVARVPPVPMETYFKLFEQAGAA